jgi:hypothetical protein
VMATAHTRRCLNQNSCHRVATLHSLQLQCCPPVPQGGLTVRLPLLLHPFRPPHRQTLTQPALLCAAVQCDTGDAVLYGTCWYQGALAGHQFGLPYCLNAAGTPQDCVGQRPANIVGYSCGGDTNEPLQANVVCCSKSGPVTPRQQAHAALETPAPVQTPKETAKTIDTPESTPTEAPKSATMPNPTPNEATKPVDAPEPTAQDAPKA